MREMCLESAWKAIELDDQEGVGILILFFHVCIYAYVFFSEEKAKLLRDIMVKIESKNETLEWVHWSVWVQKY